MPAARGARWDQPLRSTYDTMNREKKNAPGAESLKSKPGPSQPGVGLSQSPPPEGGGSGRPRTGNQDDSIPTRPSLLRRVKNWEDEASWQDFHDTYAAIVRGLALKAGLPEAEADDVVQETFVEVAKKMPDFEYDPARGSFKAWLRKLTRWRILDHLRKRARRPAAAASHASESDPRTNTIERIPDPAALDLDALWEKEWETSLMQLALDKVRRQADPEKFQIFDLYVNKEWAPEKVAQTFGISVNQVYLAKHRITEMLKAEVRRLEGQMDGGD
jgi:RNA polymerase sigma factor (sigma-70 family)